MTEKNVIKEYYKKTSIIIYLSSLILPVFWNSSYVGFAALVLGWLGLFTDPFIGISWFANILYFANLVLYKAKVKINISLSIMTIFFSFFALGIKEVPVHEGGLNEAVTVGLGFGFWLLSFIVLLIGQICTLTEKCNNI